MRTEVSCISVLTVASGPRVKLAGCKSALTPHPPPQCFILPIMTYHYNRLTTEPC